MQLHVDLQLNNKALIEFPVSLVELCLLQLWWAVEKLIQTIRPTRGLNTADSVHERWGAARVLMLHWRTVQRPFSCICYIMFTVLLLLGAEQIQLCTAVQGSVSSKPKQGAERCKNIFFLNESSQFGTLFNSSFIFYIIIINFTSVLLVSRCVSSFHSS